MAALRGLHLQGARAVAFALLYLAPPDCLQPQSRMPGNAPRVSVAHPPIAQRYEPMARTRHESSVTAISWIPSEAISGLSRIPFELGVTHYDQPPPDQLDRSTSRRSVGPIGSARRTSFAPSSTSKTARSSTPGISAGERSGPTTVRLGPASIRFPAVHLPDIQHEPEVGPALGPLCPDRRR